LVYASIADTLVPISQIFQWTAEVETTFQTLKEAFCTAPILAYPQPMEGYDGQERVMAYYNKTLNKAEKDYCVTRRYLRVFAVVRTLELSHNYLYGQEFHPLTNHLTLNWLINFRNLEEQSA
jgi:hypothetical protein